MKNIHYLLHLLFPKCELFLSMSCLHISGSLDLLPCTHPQLRNQFLPLLPLLQPVSELTETRWERQPVAKWECEAKQR